MKVLLSLVLIAANCFSFGQCLHDPTITPDAVILCPNESIVLTTQTADSYQWLKDGTPVPNATEQTLTVNYENDGGSQFTVIATVDGCSEPSPPVLVDGWAFLFPYVIHEGDEPAFIGGSGESYYCPEAFIQLTLGSVTENIQWTFNGDPIPGANETVLFPTETGYYSASGAPGVCPDFIMNLGVEIGIFFLDPVIPEIVPIGDGLCFYPSTDLFQWYLNGSPIAADACFTPTVGGTYTITADYEGCGPTLSDPYDLVLGVQESQRTTVIVYPNPATEVVVVQSASPLQGAWRMIDASGREALAGRFNGTSRCSIDVSVLTPGEYVILPAGTSVQSPVRITVLRH